MISTDIITICVAVFSFLLTTLKYYLGYTKDSLNINVIPTRSFNYLVDDKSSYNDITFINFTKFPISVINVKFDIKNKVNEQKAFKPIRCKDKNYSTPSALGPCGSVEYTSLLEEYSVIWEWGVAIKITTNRGIYIKPVIMESRTEHRESEPQVTKLTSANKVSTLSNPRDGFLKKFLYHLKPQALKILPFRHSLIGVALIFSSNSFNANS